MTFSMKKVDKNNSIPPLDALNPALNQRKEVLTSSLLFLLTFLPDNLGTTNKLLSSKSSTKPCSLAGFCSPRKENRAIKLGPGKTCTKYCRKPTAWKVGGHNMWYSYALVIHMFLSPKSRKTLLHHRFESFPDPGHFQSCTPPTKFRQAYFFQMKMPKVCFICQN